MPVPTSPYPIVEDCLNVARAKIADAGVNASTGLIQGDVLQDSRPGTFVLLQSAYEYLQDELGINGVELAPADTILTNMAPAGSTDPAVFVNIGFTGYNDGAGNHATPLLPADLKIPLWIQQRVTGTQNWFIPDPPATQANDGIFARTKNLFCLEWEWRGDAIWMNGAVQALDVRVRYNRRLPVIANGATSQNVLILDSKNALGTLTAWMFSNSVGSPSAQTLKDEADEHIARIISQSTRKQQRSNHRRRGYSTARRTGWGMW